MYLSNKYTRCYYSIINKSRGRINIGYTEKHHIIPRCLGGTNDDSNLIILTAREHFMCHLLLTRMVLGNARYKMVCALWAMSHLKNQHIQRDRIRSRTYENLKEEYSELRSKNSKGELNYFYGKKHSVETKQKWLTTRKNRKITPAILEGAKIGGLKRRGIIPHNKGKTFEELYGKERATELKKKCAHIGEKNGFFGKQHSPEQRKKKSIEKLASPKLACYYCNKQVDPMNYGRWHGENCKHKGK